jgi:YD repeat-containing protein
LENTSADSRKTQLQGYILIGNQKFCVMHCQLSSSCRHKARWLILIASVLIGAIPADAQTTPPVLPWVDIDVPASGATLSGTTTMSGWAVEGLNAVGPNPISSVAIFVDGTQMGSATYGLPRPDVCAALPGRPGCPNVGWSYNLNASVLTPGIHTLKVVATDSAGNPGSNQVTVTTPPALPWADIDVPASGATLSGTTTISGWALEGLNAVGPNPISSVAILVDGTEVGSATYGLSRPDVCAALPGRPGCPNVGWSYNLNISLLAGGSHALKVVATDSAGNTGANQVTVTTIPVVPWVDIDVPASGATLSGTTTISGWTLEGLNASGPNAVSSLAILVDGTQVGSATYGLSRSDVCAALPGRSGCPNVGWSYNFNVSLLAGGSHTLKVVATDSAGNTGSNQVTITTTPVVPWVDIDVPASGATLSGTTTISGWALDGLNAVGPNAVSSLAVFVDGTQVGLATYGFSRPDVCGALPGRPGCPNVGWSYNLNASLLAGGSHTLKVVATDSAGNTGSSQVAMTTPPVLPWVDIDVPSTGVTLSGTTTVSGWALEGLNAVGPNALSSVGVFVDGTQVGSATYGSSRPDVCTALPGRPGCPKVGWSYNLTASSLATGTHALKIVATDTAGNSGSSQVNFTIAVPPACAAGPTLLGDVNGDGAVNQADVNQILAFLAGSISALTCPSNADANQDGVITSADANAISERVAGTSRLISVALEGGLPGKVYAGSTIEIGASEAFFPFYVQSGTARIKSASTNYDSGNQAMVFQRDGRSLYWHWPTAGLPEASDYQISVSLNQPGSLLPPLTGANAVPLTYTATLALRALEPTQLSQSVDAAAPGPGIPLLFTRSWTHDSYSTPTPGPFGLGWKHSFQIQIQEFTDGSVALIAPGGVNRLFTSNSGGTYTASAGDHGVLTLDPNGSFQLREKNGFLYRFLPNLQLNFVQDRNGNSITCGYDTSGRLVSIQHSSGATFQLQYNANGLISQVTDAAGRQTQYAYDAGGTHLASVTMPDGSVTSYTYAQGLSVPVNDRLQVVSYPNATQLSFGYASNGQFASSQLSGGASKLLYSYPADGQTSITDAGGGGNVNPRQ